MLVADVLHFLKFSWNYINFTVPLTLCIREIFYASKFHGRIVSAKIKSLQNLITAKFNHTCAHFTWCKIEGCGLWKELACCICGYHVYKDVWDTSIGEYLKCQRELSNPKDQYAITVLCNGVCIDR